MGGFNRPALKPLPQYGEDWLTGNHTEGEQWWRNAASHSRGSYVVLGVSRSCGVRFRMWTCCVCARGFMQNSFVHFCIKLYFFILLQFCSFIHSALSVSVCFFGRVTTSRKSTVKFQLTSSRISLRLCCGLCYQQDQIEWAWKWHFCHYSDGYSSILYI